MLCHERGGFGIDLVEGWSSSGTPLLQRHPNRWGHQSSH